MRFNPEGDVIASGSHDKHIFLWRTYGECENYMMLKGGSRVCVCVCVGGAPGRAAGLPPATLLVPLRPCRHCQTALVPEAWPLLA